MLGGVADPDELYINVECVERVRTFWFLGVLISADMSWTDKITTVIKKAQQWLHFLRVVRKHNLNSNLLLTFYHSSIESLQMYCITVCCSSCTKADRERLQILVKTALSSPTPPTASAEEKTITKDSSHPGFDLLDLLHSGKCYRCIRTKTNRLKNSFFPKGITTLNSHMH